jgi:hypothetical protein
MNAAATRLATAAHVARNQAKLTASQPNALVAGCRFAVATATPKRYPQSALKKPFILAPAPRQGFRAAASGHGADGDILRWVMLRCEECGKEATSEVEAHHWRAYLTVEEEDEPEGVVVLCPDCAKREFGGDEGESSGNPSNSLGGLGH